MLQTQKSPNEQHKIGRISKTMMSWSTGLVLLERVMMEAFDLFFKFTACLEPILTAGLECSQTFTPTDPIWGKYDSLEQERQYI